MNPGRWLPQPGPAPGSQVDGAAVTAASDLAAIGDGATVTCEPVPVRPDCHSCRMTNHQVVAVILSQADRLLLCHRAPTRRWYPDVWDFPGGHVEPEERPEEALRREILEELGVELEGVDGAPVLHRFVPDTGLDLTVWASRYWRGNVTNMQPEEHDAIGWFRPSLSNSCETRDL
jgi:8-oxo-dGTP diphosphatase